MRPAPPGDQDQRIAVVGLLAGRQVGGGGEVGQTVRRGEPLQVQLGLSRPCLLYTSPSPRDR
ncbi:hypothetical protein, partial [Streptomyces sp. NRRL S-146]|uniref:hypothetical protein n=1 Tax=Streptomyces sp. NRRL S-146 TaxID=1463884 RepID=UPI001F34E9C6